MCVCVLMCMKAAWGLGFVGFFLKTLWNATLVLLCKADFL